jgi:hypothetical protein
VFSREFVTLPNSLAERWPSFLPGQTVLQLLDPIYSAASLSSQTSRPCTPAAVMTDAPAPVTPQTEADRWLESAGLLAGEQYSTVSDRCAAKARLMATLAQEMAREFSQFPELGELANGVPAFQAMAQLPEGNQRLSALDGSEERIEEYLDRVRAGVLNICQDLSAAGASLFTNPDLAADFLSCGGRLALPVRSGEVLPADTPAECREIRQFGAAACYLRSQAETSQARTEVLLGSLSSGLDILSLYSLALMPLTTAQGGGLISALRGSLTAPALRGMAAGATIGLGIGLWSADSQVEAAEDLSRCYYSGGRGCSAEQYQAATREAEGAYQRALRDALLGALIGRVEDLGTARAGRGLTGLEQHAPDVAWNTWLDSGDGLHEAGARPTRLIHSPTEADLHPIVREQRRQSALVETLSSGDRVRFDIDLVRDGLDFVAREAAESGRTPGLAEFLRNIEGNEFEVISIERGRQVQLQRVNPSTGERIGSAFTLTSSESIAWAMLMRSFSDGSHSIRVTRPVATRAPPRVRPSVQQLWDNFSTLRQELEQRSGADQPINPAEVNELMRRLERTAQEMGYPARYAGDGVLILGDRNQPMPRTRLGRFIERYVQSHGDRVGISIDELLGRRGGSHSEENRLLTIDLRSLSSQVPTSYIIGHEVVHSAVARGMARTQQIADEVRWLLGRQDEPGSILPPLEHVVSRLSASDRALANGRIVSISSEQAIVELVDGSRTQVDLEELAAVRSGIPLREARRATSRLPTRRIQYFDDGATGPTAAASSASSDPLGNYRQYMASDESEAFSYSVRASLQPLERDLRRAIAGSPQVIHNPEFRLRYRHARYLSDLLTGVIARERRDLSDVVTALEAGSSSLQRSGNLEWSVQIPDGRKVEFRVTDPNLSERQALDSIRRNIQSRFQELTTLDTRVQDSARRLDRVETQVREIITREARESARPPASGRCKIRQKPIDAIAESALRSREQDSYRP